MGNCRTKYYGIDFLIVVSEIDTGENIVSCENNCGNCKKKSCEEISPPQKINWVVMGLILTSGVIVSLFLASR